MKPHYTQNEANEILRRAIERAPMRDEMSREQLEALAAEVGVAPEALQRAEAEWLAEQSEMSDRVAYAAGKRLGFYKHFSAYVLFVLMIAVVTTADHGPDGFLPTIVIALLWGIPIVCHALNAFNTTSAHFESAYAKWRIERRARELAAREWDRIPPGQGA